MQIGALSFLNPWALIALLALPVIWYLLRSTPPKPDTIAFPPIRILLNLVSREETPDKTPWWLIMLRLLLAAMIIFAIARPEINPNQAVATQSASKLIILDDGWAAAPGWAERLDTLEQIIDISNRSQQTVSVVTTTARQTSQSLDAKSGRETLQIALALEPRALTPDRMALIERLKLYYAERDKIDVVWLSDGLDYGKAEEFSAALSELSATQSITVYEPETEKLPSSIGRVALEEGKLSIAVKRPSLQNPSDGRIIATAQNGRELGGVDFTFKPG